MTTIYDWATVAVFAALVVLFLHRSDQIAPPRDSLWQYIVAASGCALVNWLGNDGRHIAATAASLCLIGFILWALTPFFRGS
ncbi:XrtV sorting system accessory protein [Sphingomonas sp.]|jgi:hypothetical protein|uniref:XrtV sorting system accessory protein n=1 Tax=Sphingomonas sp. TaxID=28214 RepID=UPI002ED7AEA7